MSDLSRNYNDFKDQPSNTKKLVIGVVGFLIGVLLFGIIFRGCH